MVVNRWPARQRTITLPPSRPLRTHNAAVSKKTAVAMETMTFRRRLPAGCRLGSRNLTGDVLPRSSREARPPHQPVAAMRTRVVDHAGAATRARSGQTCRGRSQTNRSAPGTAQARRYDNRVRHLASRAARDRSGDESMGRIYCAAVAMTNSKSPARRCLPAGVARGPLHPAGQFSGASGSVCRLLGSLDARPELAAGPADRCGTVSRSRDRVGERWRPASIRF